MLYQDRASEAVVSMAEHNPDLLEVAASIMARSAEDAASIAVRAAVKASYAARTLHEMFVAERREHEKTSERLMHAEAQIAVSQYRMGWLLGQHDDIDGVNFPFGI